MKKKKENERGFTEKFDYNHFQFKFSKIKPHNRTKKDPIEVEGFFNLNNFNTIKFTIEALPEEWEAFYKYFYDFVFIHPDLFVDDFFECLIEPVIQKIKFKHASGKFRGKEPFYNELIKASLLLYLFVSYWCKEDIETWPPLLREAVKKLEEEDDGLKKYALHNPKGLYVSKAVTFYLIERYYGDKLKKFKIKCDDSDRFYDTYIARNKYRKECKERFKRLEMHSHLEATPFLIKILQK